MRSADADADETCQTLAGAIGNMLIGAGLYISFRQPKVDQVYLHQYAHVCHVYMTCDSSAHAGMSAPDYIKGKSTFASLGPCSVRTTSRVRATQTQNPKPATLLPNLGHARSARFHAPSPRMRTRMQYLNTKPNRKP
jgi:hypothetical protein